MTTAEAHILDTSIWRLVLLSLVALSGLAPPVTIGQSRTDAPIMILEESFQYRWGDSPIDERGIPVWTYEVSSAEAWQPAPTLFNPPGLAQNHLWVHVRLPEVLSDNPALGIPYVLMSFDVYVDSTRVYRAGEFVRSPVDKFAAPNFRLIPLPEDAAGRMLSIRMFSDYEGLIGIPERVYLASQSVVLRFFFRDGLDELIIGAVLMVFGMLALLLLVKTRERQRVLLLFYVGIFAFCFGSQYVVGHAVTTYVLTVPAVTYYLGSLFYLFPVGLLGFFEQMIGAGYRSMIRRLWQIHLLFFVVAVVLDILNVVVIFFLAPWFFTLLTLSLVAMIATVVPAIRRGSREARTFGAGLLIMVALGLHDTLFKGFSLVSDAPDLAHWGVLVFMGVLGYLLERRFTENTRQLQVAHAELGEYSATLEQRVEQRTEELAQSLENLKAAQDQLIQSEKLASLGQLTAGIAHEIKNPLNFVNNFSQVSVELADELVDELKSNDNRPVSEVLNDVQELIGNLKQNAELIQSHGLRADSIVQSMMQHARGGKGTRRPTNINTLLDEYVTLSFHGMRASNTDFNVTIERDYDDSVGEIRAVPEEISRVFLNLVNNAFYAVHERALSSDESYVPTVGVSTRRVGSSVEIRVRDNGAGIPEPVRKRIFEPFFTTKPTGKGTGLGLSISYDIVTQGHGGTLTVDSEERRGTTFVVTLPLA